MLTFHTVPFQFLLDNNNFGEMILAHNEEVEINNLIPDVNFDLYLLLDKNNLLHNVAVMDNNILVGYASFTISPSMHHKTSTWATDNFYYLKPKYRNGKNSLKLFQFCEESLINRNIDYMFLTCKAKKDNSRLFGFMGFEPNTQQFFKKIGNKNG